MISYITKYNYREQAEGGERQASSDIMMRVPGLSPVHHNMATWMPRLDETHQYDQHAGKYATSGPQTGYTFCIIHLTLTHSASSPPPLNLILVLLRYKSY